jgi:hypothetical protein
MQISSIKYQQVAATQLQSICGVLETCGFFSGFFFLVRKLNYLRNLLSITMEAAKIRVMSYVATRDAKLFLLLHAEIFDSLLF